jgi:glyoxylase-like metal-dependent hydrolase (beta-lactamase superfamily II)
MSDVVQVETLVVGMLEGNCYLVKCGPAGHGVIIDPGDEGARIEAEARAIGLEPEAILLTHGHIDHVNAAGVLRRRFRSRVVCHAADRKMVEDGEILSLWGLQREPCKVDQEIRDGDIVPVGGTEIKVIHSPGHTQGSVCFMIDSMLFSGDVLFKGSIGRTDLPGGSDREMAKTLQTRIAVLDSEVRVYPGHGPETTLGYEKMHNPFLQL